MSAEMHDLDPSWRPRGLRTEYKLVRTLPNGQVREQGPVKTRKDAARCMFYVLLDNGLADKPTATDLARALEMLPVGSHAEHAGYSIQIVEVKS